MWSQRELSPGCTRFRQVYQLDYLSGTLVHHLSQNRSDEHEIWDKQHSRFPCVDPQRCGGGSIALLINFQWKKSGKIRKTYRYIYKAKKNNSASQDLEWREVGWQAPTRPPLWGLEPIQSQTWGVLFKEKEGRQRKTTCHTEASKSLELCKKNLIMFGVGFSRTWLNWG